MAERCEPVQQLGRHAGLLASYDLVFQPGVNEELAATSVEGTQLAAGLADARVEGVTGFWYGKSPGLDRASDALRHANLIGTHPHGGAVAFVGDDPAEQVFRTPPFLAVEILSKDDRPADLQEKIQDYRTFGVKYIWVIDPATRRGYVYTGDACHGAARELWTKDPDFTLPLAQLF